MLMEALTRVRFGNQRILSTGVVGTRAAIQTSTEGALMTWLVRLWDTGADDISLHAAEAEKLSIPS